jgi:glyoxylase-like metal-dependent hydrolase (beta-lactamase superfamily II)
MATQKKSDHLFLIDLDQKLDGFRLFISCWIYRKNEKVILIDPGPTSTIPLLEEALTELDIFNIDYILLTHIHIDHAGGTGMLLSKFPGAKVLCHPKGIPHMIDPEKLWQGSLSVLGQIAETYQAIIPVPDSKIFYKPQIKGLLNIEVLETPGHAMHHLSFLIDGLLFAGEVAGVHCPAGDDFYLRIATPPRFIYDVYKKSLYKAAAVDCDYICFGHYDMRADSTRVFDAAKQQLELWMETVRSLYQENSSIKELEIFNALLVKDPLLRSFKAFEKDIRKREQYFALNSVKGMLEYIRRS